MKNCEDFAEHCSAYVEHELSAEEKTAFEKHIRSCPTCMQRVEALRRLRKRLRNLQPISTPPDFETILRARIQISKKVGRSKWLLAPQPLRWPAIGFAAVVLLIAVTFLMQSHFFSQPLNSAAPKAQSSTTSTPLKIAKGHVLYTLDAISFPQQNLPLSSVESPKPGERIEAALERERQVLQTDSTSTIGEVKSRLKRHIRAVSF